MTILIILLMLALNALLAAYEMALASVSRTKLSILAQEKKAGADSALFMKDHMEGSLAVVQIGITLVGAIAAACGGASADEAFAPNCRSGSPCPNAWRTYYPWRLSCCRLVLLPLCLRS